MGENTSCADAKAAQDLLAEFQRTGRQEPFEEIARRYAGMVYNVAYQVTRDAHDAEDATQAAFLTLAVHAKTAGKIRYVGPWLRKVSHRLALDIRRAKKRRLAREHRHAGNNGFLSGNGQHVPISAELHLDELRHILREELDKLPAKYRMPLILHYFGGLCPQELGKELKCNTSTLAVRLHRGRKMLADSLGRRGFTIHSAVIAAMLSSLVDSFVRDNIVHSAAQSASRIAAHGFVVDGVVSAQMLGLIRTASSALVWARFKTLAASVLLFASTLTGAEAIRRSDLLQGTVLEKLDLMRLVRPLLQRLLEPPPLLITDRSTSSNIASGSFDQPLASSWRSSFDLPTPLPAEHVLGSTYSTGSQQTAAGQIQPTPVAPFSAAAPAAPRLSLPQVLPLAQIGAQVQSSKAHSSAAVAQARPIRAAASAASSDAANFVFDRNSPRGETYAMAQGTLAARNLIVGDESTGSFDQRGGHVNLSEQLTIGNQRNSVGRYTISDGTLTSPKITVGKSGQGTLRQTGGTVDATTGSGDGEIVVAANKGSNGDYLLDGGTLQADSMIVGRHGSGNVVQNGGTATISYLMLGEFADAVGIWSLNSGVLRVDSLRAADYDTYTAIVATQWPARPSSLVVVGGGGSGAIVLGNTTHSGEIVETAGIARGTLMVRSDAGGAGTFRGWGTVKLTGPVVQNGRVVADGFGLVRTLDFSTASSIINTIENPTEGGTNGWFASRSGELLLPSIKITGTRAYTWGEERGDPMLDLVNSVRFTPRDAGNGNISLSLLDCDSPQFPPLPGGRLPLAAWRLDGTAAFSAIDLQVRYDDVLATNWRLTEQQLGLWVYEGAAWRAITDASFGMDPLNNLIWGTASHPRYFATAPTGYTPPMSGIPEPATAVLAAIGAGAMLLRRRAR